MLTFDSYKDLVDYGDVVIIFFNHYNTLAVTIKEHQITQTKYGAIKHDDLVGHQFGSKLKCSKGWVYVLNPTPELWTVSLPHRTQILYSTDISMIIFQLQIRPGSVVCECGTGSGSLSHSILRSILPYGHLHTVEFHEERSEKARKEFKDHGYENNVTVYHRDVTSDGFPITDAADAVFLDLPRPDLAVKFAMKAMKKRGARFCSFSPCIEQVQRTCQLLQDPSNGFGEIVTMELVKMSHNVKRVNMPIANMGQADGGHLDESWPYKVGDKLTVGEVTLRSEYMNVGESKKRKIDDVTKVEMKSKSYTPPAMSEKTFTSRVCSQPKDIYGHTGYLTFATYQPNV